MTKRKAAISTNGECLRIGFPRSLYEGKHKYLSLGLSDTPENRVTAEAKLFEIQRDIDYNEFDLTLEKYKPGLKKKVNISDAKFVDPITSQPEGITLQEMLDNFESRYFQTRPINRQSKKTFERLLDVITRAFSFKSRLDFKLCKEHIDTAIELKDGGTYLRKEVVECLRVFLRCFDEFTYEFEKGIASGYEPEFRDIPTDEEIIEAWQMIKAEGTYYNRNFDGNAECWGWIFAVIATYGLRPHEVLAIDYKKSFKPPNFILYIDENITSGTKTGSRFVYPLPLEWVNLFDIANPKTSYLDKNQEFFQNNLRRFAVKLSGRIKYKKITFPAYNLRHRYAIRGRELGYTVDSLAKWMGHSVEVHTKLYQKYWGDDSHFIIYKEGLARIKEREKTNIGLSYRELESELERHRLTIAQLENEISQISRI